MATSKDDSDTEQCMSKDSAFWHLFSPIIFAYCALLFLVLSYMHYRFIQHLRRNPPRPKCTWLVMITFCISQQLILLSLMAASAFCWFHKTLNSTRSVLNLLLITSSITSLYTLLIIFFLRFTLVLQRTKYKVTHCVLVAYYALFSITGICLVSAIVLYAPLGIKVSYVLISTGSAGLVIMTIFLVMTFISKLVVIYKTTDKDEEIVSIITKLALLTTMFIVYTLFVWVSVALRMYVNSLLTMAVFVVVFPFDVLVKSACLVLSYDAFDAAYQCLCKYPDQRCGRVFISKIEEQMIANALQTKTNSTSASIHHDQQNNEIP